MKKLRKKWGIILGSTVGALVLAAGILVGFGMREEWKTASTITPPVTSALTPEPTETNTPEPTNTIVPKETPVATVAPTATDIPIPTAEPTVEPTATTAPQETLTPAPMATSTPVPTATSTPTPEPTATSTPVPTATNTPKPTATNTPTPEPTATSTPVPTATSTPTPTPAPQFSFSGRVGDTLTLENENPEEITFTIKNKTENLVVDVYSTNDYAVNAYLKEERNRYSVELFGRENGTAQIVFHLYGTDENGNKKELYDTFAILVTVAFEDVPVDENTPPIAAYPYKEMEWQYGDNVTATLWTNGEDAALVLTGTGATWTATEADEHIGVSSPWIDSDITEYFNDVIEIHIMEGITHVNRIVCSYAEIITFPSTLKSIGVNAFSGAEIKELVLPEGLVKIDEDAFAFCESLEKIELPSTLEYIGFNAFGLRSAPEARSKNLVEKVKIPAKVKFIGYGAFSFRWGIEIILPDGMDTTGFEEGWELIEAV